MRDKNEKWKMDLRPRVGSSQAMKITDIRPTTVTVPLEAPLRHANGCHWGR
ncbi:MAG: glucarate dehydratase, partial [Acidobacteriaceae bacterium]|nr:glucarate dehydratase [Acidobacteriaceae bacterium]